MSAGYPVTVVPAEVNKTYYAPGDAPTLIILSMSDADTLARFHQIFDDLADKMKPAAESENHWIVANEALRIGLAEVSPSRPPGQAWQVTEGGFTVWFQWRYYDQSSPFSPQKDMNILSLELRKEGQILRGIEERFED